MAKPGEVMAIMGPSGSGKTSLLNLLSDRVAKRSGSQIEGEIYVNHQPFDSNLFGKFAAYVMQDDILMETMTVRGEPFIYSRIAVICSGAPSLEYQ